MSTLIRSFSLVLAACILAQSTAVGQTIVKPDGTGDFTTIQAAINSSGFEPEILVFPGRYDESITITRGVTIRSLEGPFFTCITGAISVDTVTFGPGVDAQVIGFSITHGKNGVVVNSTATAKIKNCVIHDNMESGIWAIWNVDEDLTDLEILNNVIRDNQADGIRLVGGIVGISGSVFSNFRAFPTLIQNNAVLSNLGFGVHMVVEVNILSGDLLIIDHNNTNGNAAGTWGPRIGAAGDVDVEVGASNIQVNPAFVDQAGGCGPDVRLTLASAMVDAGNPGPAFRDADSSVNDIGAFGGPDAASFFESPLDGPIVRSVTLTPAIVPQGETFTVEAVVAVR